MPEKKQDKKLQVEEDLEFQRKEWIVERVGWVAMLLFTLAAAIGLFGTGPVSKAAAGSENGPLHIEYQRILRNQHSFDLRMQLGQEAIHEDEFVVWIEDEYLSKFQVESITPEPDSVDLGEGRHVYHFKTSPESAAGNIIFTLLPVKTGSSSTQIGLLNGEALNIAQFILP